MLSPRTLHVEIFHWQATQAKCFVFMGKSSRVKKVYTVYCKYQPRSAIFRNERAQDDSKR